MTKPHIVILVGLASALATFLLPTLSGDHLDPYPLVVMMALAAAAGAQKLSMVRRGRFSDLCCISLGYFIAFASLLAYGARACVLVAIVSGLSSSLYPHRMRLHQILFNAASLAFTAWLTSLTFVTLNGKGSPLSLASTEAVLAAALVYFLGNTGCVAAVIGLTSGRSVLAIWRETFAWTAGSYFAGASLVMVGLLLFGKSATLLLALPVLAFIYQSYQVYTDKTVEKERHIAELQAGKQMLADLFLSTVKSLAVAINAKDLGTYAHIQRVQRYAVAIAERMQVQGEELEAVRTGALVHDIGKLGVPDYVMLKPGPLSTEEFEKMKRHAEIGASILEPVPFPWPVAGAVRHHHERWDGKGYPDGLAGEEIPLAARILAVADVYDALTSNRPYRLAWTPERAQEYLQTESGAQFDPHIVAVFLEVVASLHESDAGFEQEMLVEEEAASQIRRNSSELWALHEVAQTLNSGLEMKDRLERLGQKIASLLPGTACAFLLYEARPVAHPPLRAVAEPEDDYLSPPRELRVWAADARGEGVLNEIVPGPESLLSYVLQYGFAYRGECTDDALKALALSLFSAPVHSVLMVPLVHLGETLGVICLYHADKEAFTADDEHLLTMIAEQVQGVLYHSIQFDRTRSDALTDALTGLNNVRFLAQTVEPLLHRPEGRETLTPCALLYLDLDHFKPINDTFGHPQGDRVLKDLALRLREELRPADLLVRYGGDEFLVLLPQTTEQGALHVMQRLRKAVQEYHTGLMHPTEGEMRLDASLGLAYCPRDGSDLHALVSVADRRMYEDKANHKRALAAKPGTIIPVVPIRADAVVADERAAERKVG